MKIDNRLGELRRLRGMGASELAKLVSVSRQTIHAIEAGSFIPNTEVALRLARALTVKVEELFSLPEETAGPVATVSTDLLSNQPITQGSPVRLSAIGGRRVAVAVNAAPYYLPEADGLIQSSNGVKAEVVPLAPEEQKSLVLAGCDPAIGLLSKVNGLELVPVGASSRKALSWLMEGKVHIAGSHLEDEETGEFNLPYLTREFAGEDLAVVTFAQWEEGFVVASGNPKKIRRVEDVTKRGIKFINREEGSGSRLLLERLLREAKIVPARIHGFHQVAYGHLAAAYQVLNGRVDCCIATRSAAKTFGLDFFPLRSERYDFVMRRETMELPAVQNCLDALQRGSLRRKLEVLAGYDTSRTGSVLR